MKEYMNQHNQHCVAAKWQNMTSVAGGGKLGFAPKVFIKWFT